MTPRSPTGDGEAMSRSAPLQGWSFSIAHHSALQELTAHSNTLKMRQTTGTGDGEHQSLPEPVGCHHLGSGAKPQDFSYWPVSDYENLLKIAAAGNLLQADSVAPARGSSVGIRSSHVLKASTTLRHGARAPPSPV